MSEYKGFTLPEVLVSLLLVALISSALLKQLLHIIKTVNTVRDQYNNAVLDENQYEHELFL